MSGTGFPPPPPLQQHRQRKSFDDVAALLGNDNVKGGGGGGVSTNANVVQQQQLSTNKHHKHNRRQTIGEMTSFSSMKENVSAAEGHLIGTATTTTTTTDVSTHYDAVPTKSSSTMNKRRSIAPITNPSSKQLTSPSVSSVQTKQNHAQQQQQQPSTPSSSSVPVATSTSHQYAVFRPAVASYYFTGVPETPVQKLIRSEQKQKQQQQQQQEDITTDSFIQDMENHTNHTGTGSILMNQSYLSSSSESSSGGGIVGVDGDISQDNIDMIMNTTVLSDTTELTASNCLTLASTQRTIAEKQNLHQEQTHPFQEIVLLNNENSTEQQEQEQFIMKQQQRRRRQSVSVMIQNPIDTINHDTIPTKRRETLSTIPVPRAGSSPSTMELLLPAPVAPLPPPRSNQQKHQRERNKVAEYQRRLSETSVKSTLSSTAAAVRNRRSSIVVAPPAALLNNTQNNELSDDATTEFSLSASDMAKLLSSSVSLSVESEPVSDSQQTIKKTAISLSKAVEISNETKSPSRRKSTPKKRNGSENNEADDFLSPAHNTRSSTKKMMSTVPAAAAMMPSNEEDATLDEFIHSPARNTRSASKRKPNTNRTPPPSSTCATAKINTPGSGKKKQLFQSPKQNMYGDDDSCNTADLLMNIQATTGRSHQLLFQSPTTKSTTALDDTTTNMDLDLLSPAKNTRSATKKRLSTVVPNPLHDATTITENLGTMIHGVGMPNSNNNTTASLGKLLDGIERQQKEQQQTAVAVDDSRLDTSVTPTARNTRSAQKERTSLPYLNHEEIGIKKIESPAPTLLSPARNTRSSSQKKKTTTTTNKVTNRIDDHDDTAQLLLDFAHAGTDGGGSDSGSLMNTSLVVDHPPQVLTRNDDEDPTSMLLDGGNILQDRMFQYNKTNLTSTQTTAVKAQTDNVDMSQDSTISLDNILNSYLPTSGKDQHEENKEICDEQSAMRELGSTRSRLLGSAASKASTIATPTGMDNDSNYIIQPTGNVAPHSPPSTIRITTTTAMGGDSLNKNATLSESLHTSYVAQSPLRKALTPSRLAPSPRRFVLSANAAKTTNKSPFKAALTPSRLPPSPYRLANSNGSRINNNTYRTSLTPTKLQPSPLRLKRNVDDHFISEIEPSTGVKRQKIFEELQGLVQESVIGTVSVPASVPRSVLHSALRKKGQNTLRSSRKRVGFRSPTFAEYNKLSPAERVTPMITRQPSFSDTMYEDTVEIESDMQALLYFDTVQNFEVKRAGSTPFAKKQASSEQMMNNKSLDESNMSIDSTTNVFSVAIGEPTMTLEPDMASLLLNAPTTNEQIYPQKQEQYSDDPIINDDEENTIELETDINSILNVPMSNDQEESFHVGRRSLTFDDEPTAELESNMNALFSDENAGTNASAIHEASRPITSRRFSIAPSRRLSVSVDGIFDHTTRSLGVVEMTSHSFETSANDADSDKKVFDLTVGEVVDLSYLDSILEPNKTDILMKIEQLMRDNHIPGTMEAFTHQVLEMIKSQTEAELNPHSVIAIDENQVDICTELQKIIRLGDDDRLRREVKALASSIHDTNLYEWQTWLVSAIEQLSRPIEDRCNVLDKEIHRLDNLCFDTELCLVSISNKSVHKARKEKLKERMTDIATLESEIANMESEISRLEECIDGAKRSDSCISNASDWIKSNASLSLQIVDIEKRAETFEQKCDTLKGAMKFKPMVLNLDQFTFSYEGSSPKSCVVLTYHIVSKTSVSCSAKVDPSNYHHQGTQLAHKLSSVNSFLHDRISSFCSVVRQHKLDNTNAIPSSLRRFEWLLGRLEQTAHEIATLKERYRNKMSLSRVNNSLDFQVKIGFTNKFGATQVVATVDVTEGYPFSPLDVCLDTFHSEINVEALQKMLMKNAKPGFGYLLRISDVLSASIQSETSKPK